MTIKAPPFTPSVLLSSPRRSPGIPNWDASCILYSVTSYDFETHEQSAEICVLDVEAGEVRCLARGKEWACGGWLRLNRKGLRDEKDPEEVVLLRNIGEGEAKARGGTEVRYGDWRCEEGGFGER